MIFRERLHPAFRSLAVLLALLQAIACAPLLAQIVPPDYQEDKGDPEGQILQLKETSLASALKHYGEITQKSIIVDPQVANVTFNFRSQTKLSDREVLIALEKLMAMNNVSMVPFDDNFLLVRPIAAIHTGKSLGNIGDTGSSESGEPRIITTDLDAAGDEPIWHLLQLNHATFEEVQSIISQLVNPHNKLQYIERTNSIMIFDNASTIKNIKEVLDYMDKPQDFVEETFIYQILHAQASEIKSYIDELVASSQEDQQQAGNRRPPASPVQTARGIPIRRVGQNPTIPTPGGPTTDIAALAEQGLIQGRVQVTSDDRTNKLIILTRRENIEGFLDHVIRELDVPVAPEITVKAVRLEFAVAEELAGLLNELIGNVTEGQDEGGGAGAAAAADGRARSTGDLVNQIRNRQNNQALRNRAEAALGSADIGSLSEATKIIADERTNAILITGRISDIEILEAIIQDLDIMLPQVLVEVAILEVNLNDTLQYGVDWLQRSLTAVNRERFGPNGAVNIDTPVASFGGIQNTGAGGATGGPAGTTDASGIGRDLAVSSGGLTYFATFFDFNLDAVINLAAGSSEARVLSIPQILTTDGTEAQVVIGEARPIPTASSTTLGGVIRNTFEYRDIGINLTITPRITPNNTVVMEVSANADNVGGDVVIDGNSVPIITTRELSGEVAVQDRSTIVLGGLVSEDTRDSVSKVPVLGDIPVINKLFSSTNEENIRTELLILLTPTVLLSHEQSEWHTSRLHHSTESRNARWDKGWSGSRLAGDREVKRSSWRDRRDRPEILNAYDNEPDWKGQAIDRTIDLDLRPKPIDPFPPPPLRTTIKELREIDQLRQQRDGPDDPLARFRGIRPNAVNPGNSNFAPLGGNSGNNGTSGTTQPSNRVRTIKAAAPAAPRNPGARGGGASASPAFPAPLSGFSAPATPPARFPASSAAATAATFGQPAASRTTRIVPAQPTRVMPAQPAPMTTTRSRTWVPSTQPTRSYGSSPAPISAQPARRTVDGIPLAETIPVARPESTLFRDSAPRATRPSMDQLFPATSTPAPTIRSAPAPVAAPSPIYQPTPVYRPSTPAPIRTEPVLSPLPTTRGTLPPIVTPSTSGTSRPAAPERYADAPLDKSTYVGINSIPDDFQPPSIFGSGDDNKNP